MLQNIYCYQAVAVASDIFDAASRVIEEGTAWPFCREGVYMGLREQGGASTGAVVFLVFGRWQQCFTLLLFLVVWIFCYFNIACVLY